jgi:hypothetical protein
MNNIQKTFRQRLGAMTQSITDTLTGEPKYAPAASTPSAPPTIRSTAVAADAAWAAKGPPPPPAVWPPGGGGDWQSPAKTSAPSASPPPTIRSTVTAPPTVAPTNTAPGVSLRQGDWQSPSNIRPIGAPAAAAPVAPSAPAAPAAPQTAWSAMRGKAVDLATKATNSTAAKVAGAGAALYHGQKAARDMYDKGANLDNSTDLVASAAQVIPSTAVGATAFNVGKAAGGFTVGTAAPFWEKQGVMPEGTTMGIARASDAILNPVDTFKRLRDGGDFLVDDPTKSKLLGPETLKLMAEQDAGNGGSSGVGDSGTKVGTIAGAGARAGALNRSTDPTQESAPTIPNVKSLRDMGTSPAARLPSGVLVERDPTTGTRTFTGQGNNPNGANYIAPTSSDPGALQRSLDSMERQSVLGKQIHALRLAELDKDALMSGGQPYGGGQGAVSSLREPTGRGRLVSGVTLANRQAQAALEQQRELSRQGMQTTMRGQDLQAANNAEGHAVQRENNTNSLRASMYGRDASLAMSKAQMDIARMNHQDTLRQQGIENNRADRTLDNAEDTAGKEQLQKLLETKNPGKDGKPDADRVAAMRSSMELSMADLGLTHAQINKSGMAREQLMAGAALIDRVNSHASSFNPFMADFMKTVKPHQLLNMKRLPNGDAQTPDFVGPDGRKTPGQVIPARFFSNKEANRFLPGTPTDEFSNLFAKEPK